MRNKVVSLRKIFSLLVWIIIWNTNLLEPERLVGSAELPRRSSGPVLQDLSRRTHPELRRRTESFINSRTERIPSTPTIHGNTPLRSPGPPPISRIKEGRRYVPGEVIIKLRRDTARTGRFGIQEFRGTSTPGVSAPITGNRNLENLNKKYGVRKMERLFQIPGVRIQGAEPKELELWRVYRLRFRSDVSPELVAQDYERLAEVEYAEPNYLYTISVIPNDPMFPRQYALQKPPQGIDAVGAWDIETGDSRITLGLLDTGVDYTHEELQGRVLKGLDLVNGDSDPRDDHGHGTHIAGIIAAKGNNGRGIAGVCWNCRILAIKVADSVGAATNAWITQGILFAVHRGVRVINLSLGGFDQSKTLELAVNYANSRGVLLTAAIGNESTSQPVYPAAYPGVIAVGSTDINGNRASFSNFGDYLSLMAPGVSIYSSYPNNSYQSRSGTSMSTAFVSGVAALVLSKNPSLSSNQVRRILTTSTEDLHTLGKDNLTGYGRINAHKALGGGIASRYPGNKT